MRHSGGLCWVRVDRTQGTTDVELRRELCADRVGSVVCRRFQTCDRGGNSSLRHRLWASFLSTRPSIIRGDRGYWLWSRRAGWPAEAVVIQTCFRGDARSLVFVSGATYFCVNAGLASSCRRHSPLLASCRSSRGDHSNSQRTHPTYVQSSPR